MINVTFFSFYFPLRWHNQYSNRQCHLLTWKCQWMLLLLLCSTLFIFSERKCISKSWRKLMNYNRIPWLFTDFDNIKDFPWLFKKFPDFSLMVATVLFKSFYISEGFADRWMSWPGLHNYNLIVKLILIFSWLGYIFLVCKEQRLKVPLKI